MQALNGVLLKLRFCASVSGAAAGMTLESASLDTT